jgi:hypothetical protein
MRHYAVETIGLAMTRDEFKELLLKNNNERLRKHLGIEDISELEDYDMNDFPIVNCTTYFYDIEGSLYNIDKWEQKEFYDGEDIVLTELIKDDLYNKYNDFEEIREELKKNYRDFGIELDDKFIEEHFGRFSGVYYG